MVAFTSGLVKITI